MRRESPIHSPEGEGTAHLHAPTCPQDAQRRDGKQWQEQQKTNILGSKV